MYEYLAKFEELLDEVISKENEKGFEEFKKRIIERLDEVD